MFQKLYGSSHRSEHAHQARLDSDGKLPEPATKALREHVADAYIPILRGFLLPAAIFYTISPILLYASNVRTALAEQSLLAVGTGVALLFIYNWLQRPACGFRRLELLSLLVYALVFANILTQQILAPEHNKPMYFILLSMAAATTGVSLRVVVTATIACLFAAGWSNTLVEGHSGLSLLDVLVAGAFAALGMAWLMRSAIRRLVNARMKAERLGASAVDASEHDFLTGLPNRRAFFQRLHATLDGASEGQNIGLGLLDLNGFKSINDLYGHAFGDELLIEVGRRLTGVCGDTVFLARLGGDEYAVLVERFGDEDELSEIGKDICTRLEEPFLIFGTQIEVSTGIGFAIASDMITDPGQLYEYADYALYRAKNARQSSVEIFSPSDAVTLASIKNVEQHLRAGDLENEMSIAYQPLVSVSEGKVIGFEALARWNSPELGQVTPDVFIGAAERSGYISKLTPMLLRKALDDAKTWPDHLRLSFNLSARDMVSLTSFKQLCQMVQNSGFPGHRIDFEITETAIMADYERVRSALSCIHKLGARVALDDFGVGYSNFQHLDELSIDKLKIDRRFVSRMEASGNKRRLVRTMIEMCASLGITCIVEGVETDGELNAVRKAGGAIVQGFYFARPMPNECVPDFLAQFAGTVASGTAA